MRRKFRRRYSGKGYVLEYRLSSTDTWKELRFDTLAKAKKAWESIKNNA